MVAYLMEIGCGYEYHVHGGDADDAPIVWD
jgi:hypothetical protein